MSSVEARPRAVRHCVNSSCELRYVAVGPTTDPKCEKCGSTTQVMVNSIAAAVAPTGRLVQPWYYGAAELVAYLAVPAAVLSFIAGLVIGIAASSYETDAGTTGHHPGVLVVWILLGALGAMLWVAVATGLLLLVEIAESRHASAP